MRRGGRGQVVVPASHGVFSVKFNLTRHRGCKRCTIRGGAKATLHPFVDVTFGTAALSQLLSNFLIQNSLRSKRQILGLEGAPSRALAKYINPKADINEK